MDTLAGGMSGTRPPSGVDSIVSHLRNKERRELEFALHINQTQDRVTVQDRLVEAARKSGGSLVPNRKPRRVGGKTPVYSQSMRFQKVVHSPEYYERRSYLAQTNAKSLNASVRFGLEEAVIDEATGSEAGDATAAGGGHTRGLNESIAGNSTSSRGGLVLPLEQRQKETLNTLRAGVNLPELKHLLPAYDGDKFSTCGNYWQGQLYMARMTPAKEHIITNKFNFHQEDTPRFKVKDLKGVDIESKRNACKSICNLTWHASNSKSVIKEGGLDALQNMALSDTDELIQIQCGISFHNLARVKAARQPMIERSVVKCIAKALIKQPHASPVVLMHYLATLAVLSCSKFEPGVEAKLLQDGALDILQITGKGLSDSSVFIREGPIKQHILAISLGARAILNLTTCFDERTTYDHAIELIQECISRLSSYNTAKLQHITSPICMIVQSLCNISRYENNRARMISQGVVSTLYKSWKMIKTNTVPAQDILEFCHAVSALILSLSHCKGELRVTMIRQKAVQLLDEISSSIKEESSSLANEVRQRCAQALGKLASGGHGDGRAAINVLPAIIKLSKNEDAETRGKCAQAFKDMTERPFSRKLLVDHGVVAILSHLLDAEHIHDPSPTNVKVNCLCAICYLLIYPNTQMESIKKGAIDILLTTFERGAGRAEKLCCMTIQCLLKLTEAQDYVSGKRTLLMLSQLMVSSADKSVVQQVTATLAWLVTQPDIAAQVLGLDNFGKSPIEAFISLISTYEDQKIQQAALAALCYLSRMDSKICNKIVEHGIDILIAVITGPVLDDSESLSQHNLESGSAILISRPLSSVDVDTEKWCALLLCELSSHMELRLILIQSGVCAALSILGKADNPLIQSCVSRSFCYLSDCEGGVPTTNNIISSGAVTSLIALSSAHDESTRSNCSRALCNLTWGADAEAAEQIVGAGAVNELMILALVRSDSPATKLTCLIALANLLKKDGMIESLVEQGIVWAMTMASTLDTSDETENDRLREEGLALVAAVYSVLAKTDIGCQRLISERGGIRAVARLITSQVHNTSKSGWEILRIMCTRDCQQRLIDEGCLEVLVDMKRNNAPTPKAGEQILSNDAAATVTHNLSALMAFLLRSKEGRAKLAAEAISMLPSLSNSHGGDSQTCLQTQRYISEVICRLSSDDQTCNVFVTRGGLDNISSIAHGMKRNKNSSDNAYARSMLVLAIFKTSMHKENAKILVESGCITDLISLVDTDDIAILEKMFAIIRSLSWRQSDHDSLVHKYRIIRVLHSVCARVDVTDAMLMDCADIVCNLSYHLSRQSYEDMIDDGVVQLLMLLAETSSNLVSTGRKSNTGEDNNKILIDFRIAISFCHLACGGFGDKLISLDVIPVLLRMLTTPYSPLELRRDCMSTLCSLSFLSESRGKDIIETGIYEIVTRLSRSTDIFIRKCCGTILSNLSFHAVNGVEGSVAALLELCMPASTDTSDKNPDAHRDDFRMKSLERKNSGSIMSAGELDESSTPPGDWYSSWGTWENLNTYGSEIEPGIEIRYREQASLDDAEFDDRNVSKRSFIKSAGPPVGTSPSMPQPPAAPSIDEVADVGNPSITVSLSSILVKPEESKEEANMFSPSKRRIMKLKEENQAHFKSAEFHMDAMGSNGLHWIHPKTAGLWPLRESPQNLSQAGSNESGSLLSGEADNGALKDKSIVSLFTCTQLIILI